MAELKPVMSVAELDAFMDREFPEMRMGAATTRIEAVGPGFARLRLGFSEKNLRPGGTISGPAMMALRPERVSVSREPVEGAANCFEGKVEFVSFLGGMTDLHVHLRGEDSVVAQVVNREGEADFEIGDRVYVSWPPVDTVFAGETAA